MGNRKIQLPETLSAIPTYATVYTHLSLPIEVAGDLESAVKLQAETLSPFDESETALGYEVIATYKDHLEVITAMMSITAMEEPWHQQLEAADAVGKWRLDLTAFGWVAGLLAYFPALKEGVRLFLLLAPTECLIAAVSNGQPCYFRSLPGEASDEALRREILFVMTQLAMNPMLGELVSLDCFAPTEARVPLLTKILTEAPTFHRLERPEELLQKGLHLRAEKQGAGFDLTPQSWRLAARQAHQLRLMLIGAGAFVVLWCVAALALFTLPKYYAHQVATTNKLISVQKGAYEEVLNLRERVNLILRYQDRSQSILEILRFICAAKPADMTFSSVTYRQKQLVKLSGNTPAADDVYSFTEALRKDKRIQDIKITRLVKDAKSARQRFDIEITFLVEEDAS